MSQIAKVTHALVGFQPGDEVWHITRKVRGTLLDKYDGGSGLMWHAKYDNVDGLTGNWFECLLEPYDGQK